jgi:flavodoxin I
MASLFTKLPENKIENVLVVYGTTSGNSELVAEAVCDGICSTGVNSKTSKSELTEIVMLSEADLVILVCSTWNVGLLNDHFIKFHDDLKTSKMPGKRFAIVGLGDSKHYDIFCGAADILEQTVKDIGGVLATETVRIDGPPHRILKEMKEWGAKLVS